MTRWMRRLHIWVGLVVGLQFLLWMGSGLVMSLLDAEQVHGAVTRAAAPAPRAWVGGMLAPSQVLAAQREAVDTLATGWLEDRPVYRLAQGKRAWLVDARDGRPLTVDATRAVRLAAASYRGVFPASSARLLASSMEVRDHLGPVWRVDVQDAEETAVYVSATTGDVVAHRNWSWRVFDVAWMLHIMDYSGRSSFNHPLVIGSAVLGVLLVLGGVWLLIVSFKPRRAAP